MTSSNWGRSWLGFMADFILVPVYVLAATATAFAFAEPSWNWFGLFTAGLGAWTLTEYVMHRVIFHRFYRIEHALHHIRPRDLIGVSPLITAAIAFVSWLFAVEMFGGVGRGGAVFAGYIAGYYAYIVVHLLIHHSSTGLIPRLRAAHELHHNGAYNFNFGITTSIWDKVFRTYKVA